MRTLSLAVATLMWASACGASLAADPVPEGQSGAAPPADFGPLPPARAADVEIGACQVVVYTGPGRDEETATLCRPRDGRDAAIVLVHGGGGVGGRAGDMGAWAALYREAGFTTLSVNYLLYDRDTPGPVYPAPERDLKAAIQFLRRDAEDIAIDAEQILVHGSSAGARLGGQAHTTGGDPWFEGPGSWTGVPDHTNGFIGFYGYYDGAAVRADLYYGGRRRSPDPTVRDRWERADSASRAGAVRYPTLLVHGSADSVISSDQSTRLAEALAAAGQDITLWVIEGEDHAFDFSLPGELTPAGQTVARDVVSWLESRFPRSGEG